VSKKNVLRTERHVRPILENSEAKSKEKSIETAKVV
jgi:hypothetical protein